MQLPPLPHVLAVVAHPDDESFGLGAVISTLIDAGSQVSVLCLTSGEASTLGAHPDLARIRALELETAAAALGCHNTTLLAHPDGGLSQYPELLVRDVELAADTVQPDAFLVFSPEGGVTGHPDHEAASRAALTVAAERGLPTLEWALPLHVTDALAEEYGVAFTGYPESELPIVLEVDRTRQLAAAAEHASQAVPGSLLWRRLELLGNHEYLRLTDPTQENS